MSLGFAIMAVIAGLYTLSTSGDWLVNGASSLAKRFKVSDLFIGVAVVGFGTSLPEVMATLSAARIEKPAIALGNIVGSNIANIGLIMGIGLLLTHQGQKLLKTEKLDYALMMSGVGLFCLVLSLGGGIKQLEAAILLTALLISLYISLRIAKAKHQKATLTEGEAAITPLEDSPKKETLLVIGGLIGLFIGAELLIRGAVTIAETFGMSEKVIGLTLVAIGSSLPELAATLAAAKRGSIGIIAGNVMGSNLFNALGAAGISALVYPIPYGTIGFDLFIMGIFSVAMFPLFFGKSNIGRPLGIALVTAYAAYIIYLAFGG